jgi:hypothetical protein
LNHANAVTDLAKTGKDGRFRLRGVEGFEFRITAHARKDNEAVHAEPVLLAPGEESVGAIRLLIDSKGTVCEKCSRRLAPRR